MSEKTKAKVGLLLSAMAMMSFLAPAAVMAAMVQQFPNTNVSLIQMIITIPSLISIPLGLVAARLAKIFYKKALIVFGTCCYLVGGILPYFLHGSAEMILGCSCIIGVGMGIAMTAITALICEFFQGEERGGMLGLYAAFIAVGGTLASLLGGRLGSSVWYHAFLAYLILIPIIICEIIFLPKGHLDQEEDAGTGTKQSKRMSKQVWIIALTGFVFYVCINAINNNAAMLVAERSIGGAVESSYITTCYTIAGLVTGLFTGKIVMKLQRKSIAAAYILGAVGLLIVYTGASIPVICVGAFIAGVGFCIFASTANFHVSEMSTPSTLTFSVAFLSAIINLGQAFSPVIVNAVSFAAGADVRARFVTAAIGSIVIAVIAAILVNNKGNAEKH